jgi:hypothetical protein
MREEIKLTDLGKPMFRLFDAQRLRFVPKLKPVYLDAAEFERANEYFVRSKCPHLQWKSEAEQPVRSYKVKR